MFGQEENYNYKPVIKVIGVGGGGGNAVNRMIENKVTGIEYISANTDFQVLRTSKAPQTILLGKKITKGLGAGADPEIGRKAAEECEDEIRDAISDANLLFITAGMGGGTGSGAAPVIARIANELGILTVGFVTKPFSFEGPERMDIAVDAINKIKPYLDTLIIVPNDRLLQITGRDTPYLEAFRMVDNVLRQGVQGITELIDCPGVVNVDFADVRKVLKGAGTALMGIGVAGGETRTREAAQLAIKSSLLENSINGAKRAIVHVTSSSDLSLTDMKEITDEIQSNSSTQINFIQGYAINQELKDKIVVTVIATGFSQDPLLDAGVITDSGKGTMTIDEFKETLSEEDETPKKKNGGFSLFKKNKKEEKKNKKETKNDLSLPDWLK